MVTPNCSQKKIQTLVPPDVDVQALTTECSFDIAGGFISSIICSGNNKLKYDNVPHIDKSIDFDFCDASVFLIDNVLLPFPPGSFLHHLRFSVLIKKALAIAILIVHF